MPAASAVGESHHSNNGTNNKSPCTNDESTNDEAPFTPAAVASPLGATVPAKTDVADDTQCRFNLSSYKMVFVVNSSSYIYNHRALRRARQVGGSRVRRRGRHEVPQLGLAGLPGGRQ